MSEALSDDARLIADLKRDEGCRLSAYEDTRGIWTIGYGHAHVQKGTVWTPAQCDTALAEDVAATLAKLDARIPWWRTLNPARQDVLANMAFNMGIDGLLTFRDMLNAIRRLDYACAANAMLASKWAAQVGARARRLAEMMRTGHRP